MKKLITVGNSKALTISRQILNQVGDVDMAKVQFEPSKKRLIVDFNPQEVVESVIVSELTLTPAPNVARPVAPNVPLTSSALVWFVIPMPTLPDALTKSRPPVAVPARRRAAGPGAPRLSPGRRRAGRRSPLAPGGQLGGRWSACRR